MLIAIYNARLMHQFGHPDGLVLAVSHKLSLLFSLLRDHRRSLDLDLDSDNLAVSFLEATRLQLELMAERSKVIEQRLGSPFFSSQHSSALQMIDMSQRKQATFLKPETSKLPTPSSNSVAAIKPQFYLNLKKIPATIGRSTDCEHKDKRLVESDRKNSRTDRKLLLESSFSPASLRQSHRETNLLFDPKQSPNLDSKLALRLKETLALNQRSHLGLSGKPVVGSPAESDHQEAPRLNFLKKRKVQNFSDVDRARLKKGVPKEPRATGLICKQQKEQSQAKHQEKRLRIQKLNAISERPKIYLPQVSLGLQASALPSSPRGFLSVRDKDYSILLPSSIPLRDSHINDQRLDPVKRVEANPREMQLIRSSFVQTCRSRDRPQTDFPDQSSSQRFNNARSLLLELGIKSIKRKL